MIARWVKNFRELIVKALTSNASPLKLFFGFWLGAIVGVSPTFGVQFFLCVFLGWLFRLNPVVLYAAAGITIPPLAPFMWTLTIDFGLRILTGNGVFTTALDWRHPWAMLQQYVGAWLLGTPIVGTLFGVPMGILAALWAKSQKHVLTLYEDARNDVRKRFSNAPASVRSYVYWKTRLDPVYERVAGAVPDHAVVVDWGAGLGIMAMILALLGVQRKVHAIDWDEKKIAHARRAAGSLTIDFVVRDLCEQPIENGVDTICAIDVLHYFEPQKQDELLRRAHSHLRVGGFLIIRETNESSWLTRMIESIAISMGWNRAERSFYRSQQDWVTALTSLGFDVEVQPVAGPAHPGNLLFLARKL